jgi:outer membrane biosynthesis protein TonB
MSRLAARIELVVKGHEAQIQRCYAQAAKVTNPDDPLEGRIDVRFSVMPDGSASNVRVARNTSGSTQLGSCVAGLVGSWKFPAEVAEPVDFIWPFVFSAPRDQ